MKSYRVVIQGVTYDFGSYKEAKDYLGDFNAHVYYSPPGGGVAFPVTEEQVGGSNLDAGGTGASYIDEEGDWVAGTPLDELFDRGKKRRFAESAGREGRAGLFSEFLGDDPFGQFLNPIARGAVSETFDPLSAQYLVGMLNELFAVPTGQDPTTVQPLSFTDFLGKQMNREARAEGAAGTPQGWAQNVASREDFSGMLDTLATNIFGGPTGTTAQAPGIGGENEIGIFGAAGTKGAQVENLVAQAQMRGVNPLLQTAANEMMNRRFSQFRQDQPNLQTTLLEEYLRQRRGGEGVGTSLMWNQPQTAF
jgi:hypothetical protein